MTTGPPPGDAQIGRAMRALAEASSSTALADRMVEAGVEALLLCDDSGRIKRSVSARDLRRVAGSAVRAAQLPGGRETITSANWRRSTAGAPSTSTWSSRCSATQRGSGERRPADAFDGRVQSGVELGTALLGGQTRGQRS